MKRQSLKARKEEDASSINQYDYDDNVSSDRSDSPHVSDTESLSDYSRKIRKKRNTYQKISDDIRVKLLEAVQNGDTLKATAKLYNINYSSAKSILHTYRKEGRILKKSVQERNFKKKAGPSYTEQTPKAKKLSKKESSAKLRSNKKMEDLESADEDTTVGASSHEEKMYMSPENTEISESAVPLRTSKRQMQKKEKTEKIISQVGNGTPSKPEETPKSAVSTHENTQASVAYNQYPEHHYPTMNANHNNNYYNNQKPYENYYANYSEPVFGNNTRLAYDGPEDSYLNYPNEFDSFNDMMNVLQNKPYKTDQHSGSFLCSREVNMSHLYDDKGHKYEGDCNYDNHYDNSFNFGLKSFMDTQTLFRDTLRRNSFSNNENNSRKRKDSMDFF